MFRVTVGLGQDSVHAQALERRAQLLQEAVHDLPGGAEAVTVVDLVKATAQLVVAVDAEDALAAAERAIAMVRQGVRDTGMTGPQSIVTLEAEAIPEPSLDQPLPPHAAASTRTD